MHDDATIDCPGSKYDGMERYEARKAMVEDLKEQGLLVKVVPHSHNVGTHDRCKTTVEPMVKPVSYTHLARSRRSCTVFCSIFRCFWQKRRDSGKHCFVW